MARTNSNGVMGNVPAPAKAKTGTPEEVAGRTDVTYQPPPSNFKQLGPGDSSGSNLAKPNLKDISGSFKHGSI